MADFVHINHSCMGEVETMECESSTMETRQRAQSDMENFTRHPFIKNTILDKIYGCFIGSALGDTIGLYTEFLPKSACNTIYKDRKFSLISPVTECHPDTHRHRFEPCGWTDDTDQALLILLSYLHNCKPLDKYAEIPLEFARRLHIWVEQGLLALGRPPSGIGQMVGSVVTHPKYLEDPVDTATKRWVKSHRQGAPNGSLMRTHPIAIICLGLPEKETWKLATAVGRTTHVDPRCVVSCCISVGLIRGIARGEILSENDVNATIERAYDWVLAQPELMNPGLDPELTDREIQQQLDRHELEKHVYAKDYDELKLDSAREMGYVYKCLGSAVLALRIVIRATNGLPLPPDALFEHIITDLVMEGGDSDTNAVVAGAFVGTWLGYARLPAHWSAGLAHKEWLVSKIDRLTMAIGIVTGAIEAENDEAPDGGKGLMNREQLERRDHDMLHHILLKNKEAKDKIEAERRRNEARGVSSWFKR